MISRRAILAMAAAAPLAACARGSSDGAISFWAMGNEGTNVPG
jgi:ABC-type glycerol-3-phosphate transport system substrate-binding protein